MALTTEPLCEAVRRYVSDNELPSLRAPPAVRRIPPCWSRLSGSGPRILAAAGSVGCVSLDRAPQLVRLVETKALNLEWREMFQGNSQLIRE